MENDMDNAEAMGVGGGATADQGAAPDDQAGAGGYCIELHVKADGKMSIAVESEQEEAGEGAEDPGTPVEGLKDALQVIMDIVKNGGQMQDAGAGDDEFNAGYNQDQSGGGSLQQKFA